MCGHQGTLTGKLVARQTQDLQGCALGEIWNWACMNVSQLAGLMSAHQDALTLEGIVAQQQSLQGCALGKIRDLACTVNPKVSWIDVWTSSRVHT